MLKTRMTELLGVDYPIQCGTLMWLSRAELVAAVANAGAFACLAAHSFENRAELTAEIRKTKQLTDRVFGVNVSLMPTLKPQDVTDMIKITIDEGVKIIETAAGNPEPYRPQIVEAGLIHIHKCARVRDAAKMSRMGVDAVAIVGTEAGGHPGMEKVGSLVLIPQAVDQVTVPLIAGGGFSDGRSLVAALALGADGVLMGTRFMTAKECIIHPDIKRRLVEAQETDTLFVMESIRNPGRVLRNPWAEKVLEMEKVGSTLEQLAPVISGKITLKGWLDGGFDQGLFYCGQVVGRIKDEPSAAEIIKSIVEEAVQVKERMDGLFQ